MDFESLKNSQSNFDKISKQIESNLNPEDNENQKTNTKTIDCGNLN